MASLSTTQSGSRLIQWHGPDKRRRTLHIGKMSLKSAQSIRGHIDELLIAEASGQPVPLATAQWLGAVGDGLYAKLAAHRLCVPREVKVASKLGPYLRTYIDGRTDLKPRTKLNLEQTRTELVNYFGADKDITSINRADAADWRRVLAAKFAGATVAMHVKKARQFFANIMDRELITRNPFAKLKAGSQVNDARNVYIPAADIERVIAVCPDAEWRLIFALARYAGLRTPSETWCLKWEDINWDKQELTVHSPKTEHHEGKDKRVTPILPRLRELLFDLHRFVPVHDGYVVFTNRIVQPHTRAGKIIRRAGLTPWPRLFQNLRSSCETDFASVVPLHVACAWIGNTELIAKAHYLKVLPEDAERARRLLGAANGAAITADHARTPGVQINSETPKPPELAGVKAEIYPQGADNLGIISRDSGLLGILALHDALHAPVTATKAIHLHELCERIAERASGGAW